MSARWHFSTCSCHAMQGSTHAQQGSALQGYADKAKGFLHKNLDSLDKRIDQWNKPRDTQGTQAVPQGGTGNAGRMGGTDPMVNAMGAAPAGSVSGSAQQVSSSDQDHLRRLPGLLVGWFLTQG